MNRPISVLLVDDHASVREALACRLKEEPDLVVAGFAADADDAIGKTTSLSPDVVLMDIDMPGRACFDAAKTMLVLSPKTAVVFLSGFTNDRYIEQAMEAGAAGYVAKREAVAAVILAIRKAASGSTYYSPEIQARLVFGPRGAGLVPKTEVRANQLTQRELEVLRYVTRGLCKKDLAQTMHISVHTAHRHITSIMKKLNVHDRVNLVRYAIREGLAEF